MSSQLNGMRIGFIGLGLMGKPMMLNLHSAGADLVLYNRTRSVADDLQQERIESAATPADIAKKASVILLMTSDTSSVADVLFGPQALAEHLTPGSIVVDMGTTAVKATCEFAARLADFGVDYIDAPVSGGEIGAINGDLVFMVGGTKRAIDIVAPIFDVLGKLTVHIGAVGTGQIAKAANQVIVGLNIGAVAEALTLAQRAGADLVKVREALMGGFAASRILEVHGQRMIDQQYKPGGKITTQYKDLSQALEIAAAYGQKLPATALNRDLYGQLIEAGHGELDHSALILALQD